jgi:hypothetical protein
VAFFYRLQGGAMRARRGSARVAAAGLIAGLGLAAAAPAMAAQSLIGCQAANMLFSEGGTIAIIYPEGCNADPRGMFGTNGAFLPASTGGELGHPAGSIVTFFGAEAPAGYALYTVQGECRYVQYLAGPSFAGELPQPSKDCAAIGADTADADARPIPAWVQAYGRANADATCLEGWNPSWDLWPNGGTGGFVCQRSIPSYG